MVFIDKWSLFEGWWLLFTSILIIKEGLMKCGLYLYGGHYSEVAFGTGLTLFHMNAICILYGIQLGSSWLYVIIQRATMR